MKTVDLMCFVASVLFAGIAFGNHENGWGAVALGAAAVWGYLFLTNEGEW